MAAKRTPVPAGGQPTPATIEAADTTPATTPASAETSSAPSTTDTAEPLSGDVGEARVLVAFDEHLPDDVITAAAAEIEQLKLAGTVDPHPDAVAYARSLVA